MARKIVTTTLTTPNTTPAQGTATTVNWVYPAQAPTRANSRGTGSGSVGAALLAHLANGPQTLASCTAAVQAMVASKGRKGSHPVQPLARYIACNGGGGWGFSCMGGMVTLLTYTAPSAQ